MSLSLIFPRSTKTMHYQQYFSYYIFFFLFLFVTFVPSILARNMPDTSVSSVNQNLNHTSSGFNKFVDTYRGSDIVGLSELKKYFYHFGYLPVTDTNFTDSFDEQFESAVTLYQSKLGLPMTGRLDSTTLSQVMSPRCGVPDNDYQGLHTTKHYTLFGIRPIWNHSAPLTLTYALAWNHVIDYISILDIRVVLERAFSKWSSIVPVKFIEIQDYEHANIKIGFYYGDHGDGSPFTDNVLAHAIMVPETGMLHFNGAQTWALEFHSDNFINDLFGDPSYDLESVAVHEIGHLLGLGHSSVEEAVMYPRIHPKTKKVDLALDDVSGAQALYGSNPNFVFFSPPNENNHANKSFGLREIITISISLAVKALFF